MKELQNLTALQLGEKINKREISCLEAVRHSLAHIQVCEPQIGAFVTVLEKQALEQAAEVQRRLDCGEALSPLAGVPMGVKDNICLQSQPTTCGSRMLQEFRPPYTATALARLQTAGAVVMGKLNMDEFAMGGSCETSWFGATRNPWDIERVPGGSSGGSAAAVASGEVFFALGSDTGGSIRQPCSFCGISGLKPTYGAVSRYGLIAYASSLDQIGPMAGTIEDCARIFSVIEGPDERDTTSVDRPPLQFDHCFDGDVKELRIGIPRACFGEGLDSDVKKPVLAAARQLESLGAHIEEFDLSLVDYAVPAYYVIACAEASSNLSRYDGIKYGYRSEQFDNLTDVYLNSRSEGFGPEVKRRIMLGAFVLSSGYYDAYYQKGLQARRLIQQSFQKAFEQFDMVLTPNAPTTAYRLGENISDPLKMYLGDIYTVSVNLAGLPAVTVPCGFGETGMPVGLQLIGRPFDEPTLVRAAHAYQISTNHHLKRPAMAQGGNA